MRRNPVIAIAPDSFKGTLSAEEAAKAISSGMRRVFHEGVFKEIPMADGGEGSLDAWRAAVGAELVDVIVEDPLGRPIKAQFAYSPKSGVAFLEMARACGLTLLKNNELDAARASTYGFGEMILKALDLGVRRVILGIGGSATNDGGAGMADALGARLLDSCGESLPRGGAALAHLAAIDPSRMDKRVRRTEFRVACDVTNPLCGPNGASAVYSPQKGASPTEVRALDEALRNFASVTMRDLQLDTDVSEIPGAGAAGGLGFGLVAFCRAVLTNGVALVAESVGLREKLAGCDLVVTGEGRMDLQTANGKTPMGVARIARECGVPVIAICGTLGEGYEVVNEHGISAVFPTAYGAITPSNLADGAFDRLLRAAEQVARLLKVGASTHFSSQPIKPC